MCDHMLLLAAINILTEQSKNKQMDIHHNESLNDSTNYTNYRKPDYNYMFQKSPPSYRKRTGQPRNRGTNH
jgi:hypothetical protein